MLINLHNAFTARSASGCRPRPTYAIITWSPTLIPRPPRGPRPTTRATPAAFCAVGWGINESPRLSSLLSAMYLPAFFTPLQIFLKIFPPATLRLRRRVPYRLPPTGGTSSLTIRTARRGARRARLRFGGIGSFPKDPTKGFVYTTLENFL